MEFRPLAGRRKRNALGKYDPSHSVPLIINVATIARTSHRIVYDARILTIHYIISCVCVMRCDHYAINSASDATLSRN